MIGTAVRNSRQPDLNVPYLVFFFSFEGGGGDRRTKMVVPVSDWPRYFRLLLWNCWSELDSTWLEARSQSPVLRLWFFWPIGNPKWLPLTLIGWDMFDFFFETAEPNSTQFYWMQDLKYPLPCLCFSGWSDNQDVSDWLRHFRILFWNHWITFKLIWLETRSQCSSNFVFFRRIGKPRWPP